MQNMGTGYKKIQQLFISSKESASRYEFVKAPLWNGRC